jgi:hypothetical protein
MSRIPAEAREGLMRVWLDVLGERHPGVSWVPRESIQAARFGAAVHLKGEVPLLDN